MIIFETERLVIRQLTEDDFEDFFRLHGDADVMKYIRPAKSREEAMTFLQQIIADYANLPGLGRWAMYSKTDPSFSGSFAVIPVQKSEDIQIGYLMAKEHWGKGYASEAALGGLRYVFNELKRDRVAGITFPENIASQKVLLKHGFAFEKTIVEDDGVELNLYMLNKDEWERIVGSQ
ncbi:MAG TPA: GNAT family N-acetyltransferase [Chitinophagaceae bacterium]|jgi:ribosomal-protein-alanine N-acetyltransferase|nr:GNAT family N-acetyltransferase [Chitinophagaceae bacterium]